MDCDAFYVQVARLADPAGAGQARLLIVGGSAKGRGVVTSASYEARAYGVHSAMPTAQALHLCPHATVVPVPRSACVARSRDVRAALEERGVATLVHYAQPLSALPFAATAPHRGGGGPRVTRFSQEVLSLPVHAHLREDEVERVCAALVEAISRR